MSTVRGVSLPTIRDELRDLHWLVAVALVVAGLVVIGLRTAGGALSLGMHATVAALDLTLVLTVDLAARAEAYIAIRFGVTPPSYLLAAAFPTARWSR